MSTERRGQRYAGLLAASKARAQRSAARALALLQIKYGRVTARELAIYAAGAWWGYNRGYNRARYRFEVRQSA